MIAEHAIDVHQKNETLKQDGVKMEEKVKEEEVRKRHGSLLGDAWN